MEISDGLGDRLRRLRLDRGMTQVQLATPYSSAFVSQIEAGRKRPSDEALALFAKKLGVTVRELATGVSPQLEPEIVLRLNDGWQALYLGRYTLARQAFKTAERTARRAQNPELRAKAIVGLARTAENEGQTQDAMRMFAQALAIFEESAPAPAAAEAVAGVARCHQMSGEPRVALHVLERFLVELEQQDLSDPRALMRIYASLVWPYTELAMYDEATAAASSALRLKSQVESPEEVAGMYLNAARALLNNGLHDPALDALNQAEEIYRDLNWRTEMSRSQTARGIIFMESGDHGRARKELTGALETFRSLGFVREEARTLNELARLERLLGDSAGGAAHARRALELVHEMQAVPTLALSHRELALCLADSAPSEAEKHFREAIALYRRCGETMHAADTHRLLGDLLEQGHPHAGAAEYRAGLLLVAETIDRSD